MADQKIFFMVIILIKYIDSNHMMR